MKKKKTQIILTRIFACILVVILALGIIVPVVASAAEIAPNDKNSAVALPQPNEDGSDDTQGDDSAIEQISKKKISPGFEYVKDGSAYAIQKIKGNGESAFIIDGLPVNGFDGAYITIFVGNMETKEVKAIELMNDYSFTKSLSLPEGYYVVFSNNYVFCDSSSKAYAVEGGQYKYFHIGADFDSKKFPVDFVDANTDAIHLSLQEASDGTKITHTQRLSVSAADLQFPDGALVGKIQEPDNSGTADNNTNNNTSNNKSDKDTQSDDSDKNTQSDDEEKTEKRSFWSSIKHTLSRSSLLIVGIIACFIGMTIMRAKKQASLDEQSQADKDDDGHIL